MYNEHYSTTLHSATALAFSPFLNAVAAEAHAGLSRYPKTLPPKLFYDDIGCRLFQSITELPEYYLTRTERDLLGAVAPAVAELTPPGTVLVEYGASDEGKAAFLFQQNCDKGPIFDTYVPIDIASDGLEQIDRRLKLSHPGLRVCAVTADFSAPLTLPAAFAFREKLGFFPGSTIGNFEPTAAVQVMRQIGRTLGQRARLFVGVDLRKDPDILLPAYNDRAGVTAAFNLNLLARLNREAEADFDLESFAHQAVWNDEESRIEMHLISHRHQTVHLAGREVRFIAGESIHTENSYKHTLDGFTALARMAGWCSRAKWTDRNGWFALHLLEPERRAL